MGQYLDLTAVTPVLKERYTTKKVESIVFQSPAVGMMPKKKDGGGLAWNGAIRTATTSASSPSDSIAFGASVSPSKYNSLSFSWYNNYVAANVTGAAIAQSRGNENALIDAFTAELDGAFLTQGIYLGTSIFGNGGGALGQISTGSTVGSATITLANINDIAKFFVGMTLQASTDDGTGGAGVLAGTVTVTGVNVSTGTVTASGNWTSGIASIGTGDYLFLNGAYNGYPPGLPGWIPNPTVSLSGGLYTSFGGLNRSNDPTRLAGVNYAGNGAPKTETMTQLMALVSRLGGKPTTCFVNNVDNADLLRELGTRAIITTVEAYKNPQVSFPATQIATPHGTCKIVEDPFVPQGYFWLVNPDEWELVSIGELPEVIDEDGMSWLRQAGVDAYQLRTVCRWVTFCSAPGHQGCGSF